MSQTTQPPDSPARVDRWLWCVRLFKTRSAATEACRRGEVCIGDQVVKASRDVRSGELITIQQGLVTRVCKILGAPERRVGAKLVPQFLVDLTPSSEWEKVKQAPVQQLLARAKGAGRPTKKERRALDSFFDGDVSA